ncbi:hypothetical protein EV44_g5703 [Erysiphe necator]|uniref:Uncharacterized protein n=1 Tax=Uncinula necator TaxID=52586 RepID=A0A0B1PH38_UNCNE|nr:hypothetical protein EV44_g5703 [Erysiphe necator]
MVDIRFGGWQNPRHAEVTGGSQILRNDNDHYTLSYELNNQEVKKFQRRQVVDLDTSGDAIMGSINAANVTSKRRRRTIWKTKLRLRNLGKKGDTFDANDRGV